MIPKETIDIIFDTTRIEEVVGDFVTLKKRGVNLLGNCPFHNEKTPSFTVSPTKGIYKCFGCGKAGNAVNFVMEHEHSTYPEALRYLARKYNIEIEEEKKTSEELDQINERESLYIVSTFAQKHFTENLLHTEEGKTIGLSYFKERGFKENTIEKFQLGYSLDHWSGFTEAALQKGYLLENLVKTGLSILKENSISSPTGFDRFSGRVIFPIHNLSGRVIAFGGRTLKADKRTAKYINSPETDIYSKSKVLYGAFFAKKAIISADNCYLVEGYTDVVSFHQAGIENVVASSGTSLTVEQIRLIKRYTNNITILYDGDAAGIKASFRGIDLILEEGMNVKIVLFPDGDDPDSFARKSTTDDLKTFITDNANDFIVFKSNLLLAEAQNDPIKKAGLIREIIQSIALIDDGINRSVYVKECSRILDVSEQALINELNKVRRKNFSKQTESIIDENIGDPLSDLIMQDKIDFSCEAQEKDIIRVLLTHGNKTKIVEIEDEEDNEKVVETETTIAKFIVNTLADDSIEFETPLYQLIFNEFIAQMENGVIPEENHFINHPDPQISSTSINLLSSPYSLSEGWLKHNIMVEGEDVKLNRMVLGAVYSFKNKKVEQMIQKNQQELKEDKPYEELILLIQEQKLLLEAKQALSAHLGRIVLK